MSETSETVKAMRREVAHAVDEAMCGHDPDMLRAITLRLGAAVLTALPEVAPSAAATEDRDRLIGVLTRRAEEAERGVEAIRAELATIRADTEAHSARMFDALEKEKERAERATARNSETVVMFERLTVAADARIDVMQRQLDTLTQRAEMAESQRDAAHAATDDARAERDEADREVEALRVDIILHRDLAAGAVRERDEMSATCGRLAGYADALRVELEAAKGWRARRETELEEALRERDDARAERDEAQLDAEALRAERDADRRAWASTCAEAEALRAEIDELSERLGAATMERDAARAEAVAARQDFETMRMRVWAAMGGDGGWLPSVGEMTQRAARLYNAEANADSLRVTADSIRADRDALRAAVEAWADARDAAEDAALSASHPRALARISEATRALLVAIGRKPAEVEL